MHLEQAKTLTEMHNKCALLEQEVADSWKKLRSTQTMLTHIGEQQSSMQKKKECNAASECGDFVKLCQELDKFFSIHYPGKHAKSKAKLLLNALSSENLFNGEGAGLLAEMNRLYVQNVFKDWKVLKAFNCSPIGAFKSSTVKALTSVLDEGKIGLFPSPSAVDRARQMVDKYAIEKVGCQREITKYGEVYFLNYDHVIQLLLKATGLYEKVQQSSVSISFTADGALLFNSRTHVSYGIKIMDTDGIHIQ
jgi:hypothetical protein